MCPPIVGQLCTQKGETPNILTTRININKALIPWGIYVSNTNVAVKFCSCKAIIRSIDDYHQKEPLCDQLAINIMRLAHQPSQTIHQRCLANNNQQQLANIKCC